MCIIALKKTGVELNNKEWDMLENSHDNNPDGSGYSYRADGHIYIRKGFFTIDELKKSILAQPINTTDTEILFHFRIATHGKVSPSTCHPFISTSNKKLLKLRNTKTQLPVVAHNGIISSMPDDKFYSDTMLYIRYYLSKVNKALHLKAIRNLIELSIDSSKLIIMTLDDTYYIGDGFVKDKKFKNWIFSNDSFKEKTKIISGSLNDRYGHYSHYDHDYNWSQNSLMDWSECSMCSVEELANDLVDGKEFNNGHEWNICETCFDSEVQLKRNSKKTDYIVGH